MDKEIVEGNKLIADFMGVSHAAGDNGLFYYVNGDSYDSLEYHTSWDWLMPVVEKMLTELLHIGTNDAKKHYTNILRQMQSINIKIVWPSIVDAAKWYNQNKTS